jgi:hypothetical protein
MSLKIFVKKNKNEDYINYGVRIFGFCIAYWALLVPVFHRNVLPPASG